MTEPVYFIYTGKSWKMDLTPHTGKNGETRLIRRFTPVEHHPPVAQFKRAAQAYDKVSGGNA